MTQSTRRRLAVNRQAHYDKQKEARNYGTS